MQSAQPQGKEMISQQRVVPYTYQTINPTCFNRLCKIFQVKESKVEEWLKDDLIRLCMKNWKDANEYPNDIAPLLA